MTRLHFSRFSIHDPIRNKISNLDPSSFLPFPNRIVIHARPPHPPTRRTRVESTARQKKGLRPLSPPDRVLSFLETVPGRPRDVARENILGELYFARRGSTAPHLSLSRLKNTGPPSSVKAFCGQGLEGNERSEVV